MSKADDIIGYTIFDPAAPVVTAKMRNVNGLTAGNVVQALPARIAAGNYGCQIGAEISPREVETSPNNCTNAAGDLRSVTIDWGAPANGVTPFNIMIWADDAVTGIPALSDDAVNVGVVVRRLPLAP